MTSAAFSAVSSAAPPPPSSSRREIDGDGGVGTDVMMRSVATRFALFVATAAVSIGTIGRTAPHLFMTLPFPLSIVLWAGTGNPMPPFILPDAQPWHPDEVKTWTRPGDVVVSAGVKAGTTWMLYCTHQIRLRGSDDADDLFREVSMVTPWPEFIQSRGGTWESQKAAWNETVLPDGTPLREYWDNDRYPFRIFKSHYAPSGGDSSNARLPVRTEGGRRLKFVAVARNGLDVASSMIKFFGDHSDDFRKLWGGFPPAMSASHEEDAEARITELLPGGMFEFIVFDYVKGWWSHRNDPNVLLLHYADLKRDLKGSVRKIAKFLDIDLSSKQLNAVTERCGIDHMRRNKHKFRYSLPLNDNGDRLWDRENGFIIHNIVNTGDLGRGQQSFTEDQKERWREAEESIFGSVSPELLRWAREGGPLPP